jgi:hypothetical protein
MHGGAFSKGRWKAGRINEEETMMRVNGAGYSRFGKDRL